MAIQSLPNRSEMLFGREPDLAYLFERCSEPGLTAITGRPRMGKSWLLSELARRLSTGEGVEQAYQVGLVESRGEPGDLFLRGILDLYTRWLAASSFAQQGSALARLNRKDLVAKAGKTVGVVTQLLSKLGGKPTEVVGDLVKEWMEGLARLDSDLKTGAILLPRLPIEQGKELLDVVQAITEQPLVLVFDQWEQSPKFAEEISIFRSFLDHAEEWPPCHIVVGLRPEGDPWKALRRLIREFKGPAEVYDLPAMHLGEGFTRTSLLQMIRTRIPVAAAMEDENLLDLIAGYPGTLSFWINPLNRRRLTSSEALDQLARESNANRFVEFEELFPELSEAERGLGIRLALLPTTAVPENWAVLSPVVLGADATAKDGLGTKGILESTDPPSYGHAKRYEAALNWLKTNCREELRVRTEALILKLGAQIRELSRNEVKFANGLVALMPLSAELRLSDVSRAVCEAAATLFGPSTPEPQVWFEGVSLVGDAAEVAPLLAMGLNNMLVYAKMEAELSRRDALLKELRALSAAHPQDAAVREQLVKGLNNMLVYAKAEGDLSRRDALLEELRALSVAHPQETAVREWLAKGLNNMLVYAKAEGDLSRRDALLEELRALSVAHPQETAVREQLAKGLFNTLNDAKEEGDLARRHALLEELRVLAAAHPQEAALREQLVKGLFNTLVEAKAEREVSRRDRLLKELRALSAAHPQEAAVREHLAKGLFNTLNDAKEEGDLARRHALLEELRVLAAAHEDEAIFQEIRAAFATEDQTFLL